MHSSILARIPGFRQQIIPEPHVPSRGSQARGTRLIGNIKTAVRTPSFDVQTGACSYKRSCSFNSERDAIITQNGVISKYIITLFLANQIARTPLISK